MPGPGSYMTRQTSVRSRCNPAEWCWRSRRACRVTDCSEARCNRLLRCCRCSAVQELADYLAIVPVPLDVRPADDDPAHLRVGRGLVDVGKVIAPALAEE